MRHYMHPKEANYLPKGAGSGALKINGRPILASEVLRPRRAWIVPTLTSWLTLAGIIALLWLIIAQVTSP